MNDMRRESRYSITNTKAVVVTIEHAGRSSAAQLLDLSRSGMRLSVGESFPQGAIVTVKMEVGAISSAVRVEAKVCWISPGIDGEWVLGCAVQQEVDENWIVELAVNSILERRRDGRAPTALAGELKSELGSNFTTVQLVDYSAGGFAGRTETVCVRPGERLMLRFTPDESTTTSFHGKVIWTRPDNHGGQLFGCSYTSRDDHLQLQSLVNPDSRNRWLRELETFRPTHWRMVAAAVFMILTLQLVDLACQPRLVRRLERQVMHRVEPWWDSVRHSIFAQQHEAAGQRQPGA